MTNKTTTTMSMLEEGGEVSQLSNRSDAEKSSQVIVIENDGEEEEEEERDAKTKHPAAAEVNIEECHVPCKHTFPEDEVAVFRTQLLRWYDSNQRQLPWRQPVQKSVHF